MADNLLISAGDVIEVQLTSETVVMDGGRAQAAPGHITNRMRIFVRETDGAERTYDFEESELGVRDGQRVAVVRARIKGETEPVNLILFNLSAGKRDLFEAGLAAHLGRRPFFGPRWKAFALSLGLAGVFYFVSHYQLGRGPVGAGFLAAMFAFLAYPVFWWIAGSWDRITERIRYGRARKLFIADMDGRVKTYAP